MAKIQSSSNSNKKYVLLCLVLVSSMILNLLSIRNQYVGGSEWNLSWSGRAAKEAEEVAAISCSGHGRAYLDGVVLDARNQPVCECNTCFSGPDCSLFLPDCDVDADGGDPLFLEPIFWMQNAASSALVVAGWQMSYQFKYNAFIFPKSLKASSENSTLLLEMQSLIKDS